jgi:hypothetical protein
MFKTVLQIITAISGVLAMQPTAAANECCRRARVSTHLTSKVRRVEQLSPVAQNLAIILDERDAKSGKAWALERSIVNQEKQYLGGGVYGNVHTGVQLHAARQSPDCDLCSRSWFRRCSHCPPVDLHCPKFPVPRQQCCRVLKCHCGNGSAWFHVTTQVDTFTSASRALRSFLLRAALPVR